LTKLCGSCGKGLHDSDRFCDRCGAAQPTRSPHPESHRKPAESVPRTELDSLRASLVARIGELEAQLSESTSRQETDKLHVRLRQLESLLAESVPRREAKAETDSLRAKVAQLQDRLAELAPKAELEAKANELATANKTIEDLTGQLSRSSAKIEELQSRLSDSVPRRELETVKNQLEPKIVELEAKLAVSILRSEAKELRAGTPVASRSPQTHAQKVGPPKCPLCKYKNRRDAIYCASCGHKLEDKTGQVQANAKPSTAQSSSATTSKTVHLGGLSKLKSHLRSRFRPQKNTTPHSPNVQSGHMLEAELTKLKSLYESGALTETEYERKKKLLTDV